MPPRIQHRVQIDGTKAMHEGTGAEPVRGGIFDGGLPHYQAAVQAHNVGNCYFIAALKAILAVEDGPAYIVSLFRDEGTTIVVRFYRYGYDSSGEAFIPCDVRIRKTIPSSLKYPWGRTSRATTRPTWLLLLEKAYAIFRKDGGPFDVATLEGGCGDVALANLLGQDVGTVYLGVNRTMNANCSEMLLLLGWPRHRVTPSGQIVKIPVPWCAKERSQKLKEKIGAEAWREYVGWLGENITRAWSDLQKRIVLPRGIDGSIQVFRREDFDQFLEAHRCPTLLRARLMAYVDEGGYLAGKRGTGLYTAEQLSIYGVLDLDTAKGYPVIGNTVPFFDKDGGVASRGLLAAHTYAILGTKEEGGLLYVRVQNTWNRYGRVYQHNTRGGLSAHPADTTDVTDDHGTHHEFSVELSDFCKKFRSFSRSQGGPWAQGSPASSSAPSSPDGSYLSALRR